MAGTRLFIEICLHAALGSEGRYYDVLFYNPDTVSLDVETRGSWRLNDQLVLQKVCDWDTHFIDSG